MILQVIFYDHYYVIVPTHWLPGDFFMVVILIDILKCTVFLTMVLAIAMYFFTTTHFNHVHAGLLC